MGARMLRKGLAVAVILLFIGLALAPTTYADVDKPELEVVEENVNLWKYPFYCTILFGVFVFFVTLLIMGASVGDIPFVIDDIGDELNCYWCDILP